MMKNYKWGIKCAKALAKVTSNRVIMHSGASVNVVLPKKETIYEN